MSRIESVENFVGGKLDAAEVWFCWVKDIGKYWWILAVFAIWQTLKYMSGYSEEAEWDLD